MILAVESLDDGMLMVSLFLAAIQACNVYQQNLGSSPIHKRQFERLELATLSYVLLMLWNLNIWGTNDFARVQCASQNQEQ